MQYLRAGLFKIHGFPSESGTLDRRPVRTSGGYRFGLHVPTPGRSPSWSSKTAAGWPRWIERVLQELRAEEILNREAREYEDIRRTMPAGEARSIKMDALVDEVRSWAAAAPASARRYAAGFLRSARAGDRIVGLSLAQAEPSADDFADVFGSAGCQLVGNPERQAFNERAVPLERTVGQLLVCLGIPELHAAGVASNRHDGAVAVECHSRNAGKHTWLSATVTACGCDASRLDVPRDASRSIAGSELEMSDFNVLRWRLREDRRMNDGCSTLRGQEAHVSDRQPTCARLCFVLWQPPRELVPACRLTDTVVYRCHTSYSRGWRLR
jgi:hypothetical protein